jgi:hypothetical protein
MARNVRHFDVIGEDVDIVPMKTASDVDTMVALIQARILWLSSVTTCRGTNVRRGR